jgi:hypothetical protein
MILRRFLFCVAVACALCCGANAFASEKCVAVGFTITHLTVSGSKQQACGEKAGGTVNLNPADYVLNEYSGGAGHDQFRGVLARMALQAESIRTIVWFRHSEDPSRRAKNDHLGLRVATAGKLPQRDVAALLAFLRDAHDAHFSRVTVVLGGQGSANPKCRKGDWGECYDAELLPLSWSVVEQVVSSVKAANIQGMRVVFDIAPTACFDASQSELLRGNLSNAVRYMVTHYSQRFHDRDFIVSCGSRNGKRASAGLRALAELYRDLDVRPASLDIHVYETREAEVRKLLLEADELASGLNVPLEILESFYQHPNLPEVIRSLRSSGHLEALATVQVFPRTPPSLCQENVEAPYPLAEFRQRAGLSSRCG